MKKIFSAALRCLLASLLLLCGTGGISASAKSGKTVNIENTVVYKNNITIDRGDTLYIRSGGTLYISEGTVLTVNGALKCAAGGAIYSKGKIVVNDGGLVSVTGKLKLLSTGSMALTGKLMVNENGLIKGLGSIEMVSGTDAVCGTGAVCEFKNIFCKGTVTAKIVPPAPVTENGVTTVGGVIIVNREYGLPEDYGSGLNRAAYSAYLKMKEASGYDMEILSGYRSYAKQEQVYKYWCDIDGVEAASRYSAEPGHSEHQTGLAIDITSLKTSYGDTPEGKWLAENCWKYGFIIRYPKDGEPITGYIYEPWHVRYLGTSLAKMVYDSGLTLEEFFCVDR